MKTALIVHGLHANSNENWFPWLKKELENNGWRVICPDLPNFMHPSRQEWLDKVKELTKGVNFSDLAIIAHSLGVPTSLDLIESEEKKIPLLVSVAGFAVPYGFEPNEYFLKEKPIDLKKVQALIGRAVVICSDDDPYVTLNALSGMTEGLGVEPVIVKGGKHFNKEAGYTEFPLLLRILDL